MAELNDTTSGKDFHGVGGIDIRLFDAGRRYEWMGIGV